MLLWSLALAPTQLGSLTKQSNTPALLSPRLGLLTTLEEDPRATLATNGSLETKELSQYLVAKLGWPEPEKTFEYST